MPISYPLALPALGFARIRMHARSTVAQSRSPFTGEQQTYVHQGEWWEAEVSYPPLKRADAEEVIGFLLALNGAEGSFLMGPTAVDATQRGTWAGQSPQVNGGGQTGKTLAIKNLAAGSTIRRGDWFQLGSGATARLHRVVQDATANGSGQATLDIWPRLREAPANNAPITLASPRGRWMLASPAAQYEIEPPDIYGISFSCVEDLRPL